MLVNSEDEAQVNADKLAAYLEEAAPESFILRRARTYASHKYSLYSTPNSCLAAAC